MTIRVLIARTSTLYGRKGEDKKYELEVTELPLWDVVKAELFEKYVEGTLWQPALWLDNHFGSIRKSEVYRLPLDILLEMKSYDLRYHSPRSRILGRISIQKDDLKPQTPMHRGKPRR